MLTTCRLIFVGNATSSGFGLTNNTARATAAADCLISKLIPSNAHLVVCMMESCPALGPRLTQFAALLIPAVPPHQPAWSSRYQPNPCPRCRRMRGGLEREQPAHVSSNDRPRRHALAELELPAAWGVASLVRGPRGPNLVAYGLGRWRHLLTPLPSFGFL